MRNLFGFRVFGFFFCFCQSAVLFNKTSYFGGCLLLQGKHFPVQNSFDTHCPVCGIDFFLFFKKKNNLRSIILKTNSVVNMPIALFQIQLRTGTSLKVKSKCSLPKRDGEFIPEDITGKVIPGSAVG